MAREGKSRTRGVPNPVGAEMGGTCSLSAIRLKGCGPLESALPQARVEIETPGPLFPVCFSLDLRTYTTSQQTANDSWSSRVSCGDIIHTSLV